MSLFALPTEGHSHMAHRLVLPDGSTWRLSDSQGYLDQVTLPFGGERHGMLGRAEEVLITNILLVPPSQDLVTATDLGNLQFVDRDGSVRFSVSVAALMNRYRMLTNPQRDDLTTSVLPRPLLLHPNSFYAVRHVGFTPQRSVDETLAVALDLLQEKGLVVDVVALRQSLQPAALTVEIQAMGRHLMDDRLFRWAPY
jgi:hypothetical protein